MDEDRLQAGVEDLNRTFTLPPYEGFEVAWVALIKLANLLEGSSEHKRLEALLDRLSEDVVQSLLAGPAVDELLSLDPPLETILADPHERLDAERTAQELGAARTLRRSDPKEALRNLTYVLKRFRNRRAHGFKTPSGPRDREILAAGVRIARDVGAAAAEALGAK